MDTLTVNVILNGAVYVPYVDNLKDGKTAFQYPLKDIVSALNNEVLSSIIPSKLTLEGFGYRFSQFFSAGSKYRRAALKYRPLHTRKCCLAIS